MVYSFDGWLRHQPCTQRPQRHAATALPIATETHIRLTNPPTPTNALRYAGGKKLANKPPCMMAYMTIHLVINTSSFTFL